MGQLSAYRFPESSGGLKWELWKHVDGTPQSYDNAGEYRFTTITCNGSDFIYKKPVAFCFHTYGTLYYNNINAGTGSFDIGINSYENGRVFQLFSNWSGSGGTKTKEINDYRVSTLVEVDTQYTKYFRELTYAAVFPEQNRTIDYNLYSPVKSGNALIMKDTQLSLNIYAMFLPEFEIK